MGHRGRKTQGKMISDKVRCLASGATVRQARKHGKQQEETLKCSMLLAWYLLFDSSRLICCESITC